MDSPPQTTETLSLPGGVDTKDGTDSRLRKLRRGHDRSRSAPSTPHIASISRRKSKKLSTIQGQNESGLTEEQEKSFEAMRRISIKSGTRSLGTRITLVLEDKKFLTTAETLVRADSSSILASISITLSTQSPENRVFEIERSPKHFQSILNYLRDGETVLPRSETELEELALEAKFYHLKSLYVLCMRALEPLKAEKYLSDEDKFWRDCIRTMDLLWEEKEFDEVDDPTRNQFPEMFRRLAAERNPMLRIVHATYKGTSDYRDRLLEVLQTKCHTCGRQVYYKPIGLREGRETGCPMHPPTGYWDRKKREWSCCGSPDFNNLGCKLTGVHYTIWTFFSPPSKDPTVSTLDTGGV
jgi:hypothetical protein